MLKKIIILTIINKKFGELYRINFDFIKNQIKAFYSRKSKQGINANDLLRYAKTALTLITPRTPEESEMLNNCIALKNKLDNIMKPSTNTEDLDNKQQNTGTIANNAKAANNPQAIAAHDSADLSEQLKKFFSEIYSKCAQGITKESKNGKKYANTKRQR